MRLVVPWKYGFKSIKSLVKISLLKTAAHDLESLGPQEYGFYSNVNPTVTIPVGARLRERRLPEPSRSHQTLMFNGYGDQVASLYAGMDLRKNY